MTKTKLIHGIGTNEKIYPACIDGKHTDEYASWLSMLCRCTEKLWSRCYTYHGVTCSDNFKSYTYFYEWYHRQIGASNKDARGKKWCLDKDILVKGNKVYSEDTCVFIPHRVNSLLTKSDSSRGGLPIGVHFETRDNRYKAQCRCISGKQKNLGLFKTSKEAFVAYKLCKEDVIKKVAEEYKYQLDYRVYESLMKYEVSEND